MLNLLLVRHVCVCLPLLPISVFLSSVVLDMLCNAYLAAKIQHRCWIGVSAVPPCCPPAVCCHPAVCCLVGALSACLSPRFRCPFPSRPPPPAPPPVPSRAPASVFLPFLPVFLALSLHCAHMVS